MVVNGGAGVDGDGGLVQSVLAGLSGISPNSLLMVFNRGNDPSQHLLLKSSKSIVQATAPPNPRDLM